MVRIYLLQSNWEEIKFLRKQTWFLDLWQLSIATLLTVSKCSGWLDLEGFIQWVSSGFGQMAAEAGVIWRFHWATWTLGSWASLPSYVAS